MPGLPRKSTANQFKKLMKKSGKSRANKAAGATDPSSKKIATYEQYWMMKEMADSDIDPYGEEKWDDVGMDLELEIKKLHAWLVEHGDNIWEPEYELIYITDDNYSIELLKKVEDDELEEDENFFFGIYLANGLARLFSNYLKPDEDENDWEDMGYNKEGLDPNSDKDKQLMLKKLKKVIKSADYYYSEQ